MRRAPQEVGGEVSGSVILMMVLGFVGGIIGIIFFSQRDPLISGMFFGGIFLTFGLVMLSSIKLSWKRIWILIFPLIGLGIMTTCAIFKWGSDNSVDTLLYLLPIILLSIFVIMGIYQILSTALTHNANKKRCCNLQTVVCDSIDYYYQRASTTVGGIRRRRKVYIPYFKFYYNGHEYKGESCKHITIGPPRKGKAYEIGINPDNPEDVYWVPKLYLAIELLCGMVFLSIGSIFIYFYLIGTF